MRHLPPALQPSPLLEQVQRNHKVYLMDKEVLVRVPTHRPRSLTRVHECSTTWALLRTSCYDLTVLAATVQTSDVLQDKRRDKHADTRPHMFVHAHA